MPKKGKGAKHRKQAHKQQKYEARRQRVQESRAWRKRQARYQYGDAEWNKEFNQFSDQLRALGLRIKDVAGDGNCLFRAVADQLEGRPDFHAAYRAAACAYIEKHREDFEPFIEDDVPFDRYLKNMKQDKTWGGHLEIQAMSLVYEVNIVIHQFNQPRWEVVNFPGNRSIHLSYHDGDHYASVRKLEDSDKGKPSEISIEPRPPDQTEGSTSGTTSTSASTSAPMSKRALKRAKQNGLKINNTQTGSTSTSTSTSSSTSASSSTSSSSNRSPSFGHEPELEIPEEIAHEIAISESREAAALKSEENAQVLSATLLSSEKATEKQSDEGGSTTTSGRGEPEWGMVEGEEPPSDVERFLMDSTCCSLKLVRETLNDHHGDVEQTINLLMMLTSEGGTPSREKTENSTSNSSSRGGRPTPTSTPVSTSVSKSTPTSTSNSTSAFSNKGQQKGGGASSYTSTHQPQKGRQERHPYVMANGHDGDEEKENEDDDQEDDENEVDEYGMRKYGGSGGRRKGDRGNPPEFNNIRGHPPPRRKKPEVLTPEQRLKILRDQRQLSNKERKEKAKLEKEVGDSLDKMLERASAPPEPEPLVPTPSLPPDLGALAI